MKIEVTDSEHTFGRQTRAYAEYRVFSTLAPFAGIVRDVDVSLTPEAKGYALASAVVHFETGAPVRVAARGRHAYDAINSLADRLGPEVRRQAQIAVPSRNARERPA